AAGRRRVVDTGIVVHAARRYPRIGRHYRARLARERHRPVVLRKPSATPHPPVGVNRPSLRSTVPRFTGGSNVFRNPLARAAMAMAFIVAAAAHAATDTDLDELRKEIRQLRQTYEARIDALEARVRNAESATNRAAQARDNAPLAPPAVATAPAAPPIVATPPAAGPVNGAPASANAFNPAISAVLEGVYSNLSQDPTRYGLAGFPLTGDVSPGRRGLGIGESEFTLSANVDTRFAGNLTVALTPENTVSVEEAYGLATDLASGLVPKFGRFFSGIGYLNEQHQHAWDFYDAPLAYQAFLGGQYATDGAQVKWLAPSDQFLEFGAEIGNGDSFPGSVRNRNGVGAADVFVHTGG